MKKIVVYICCGLFCAFEIVLLVMYFKTFNGTISPNTEDWALFCQLTNGLVMAFLTIINIAVFYKISILLDVKGKLFEAQSIITQIRVKQYEYLRNLIKNIQVQLIRKNLNTLDIEELKKGLMEMDNSYLYKNDNMKDPIFFHSLINKICNDYKIVNNQVIVGDSKNAYINLSFFLQVFEFYIIQQMIRDKEQKKYIEKNKGFIDSTIVCFHEMEQEIINKTKGEDNK